MQYVLVFRFGKHRFEYYIQLCFHYVSAHWYQPPLRLFSVLFLTSLYHTMPIIASFIKVNFTSVPLEPKLMKQGHR